MHPRRCIYKQLTINTQRAIDNERGDVSRIWIRSHLQLEPRVFGAETPDID